MMASVGVRMLDQLSKNHLNSAGDGELYNCFVVSNELHLLSRLNKNGAERNPNGMQVSI